MKCSDIGHFPAALQAELDSLLQAEIDREDRVIVVLDDDPTGVQTVRDVYVYTCWDTESLVEAFSDGRRLFYILINSRSLAREQTAAIHREIALALDAASRETGRDYLLISRSDSTLRGHYPLETEVLRACLEDVTGRSVDGEILCFFLPEGGRYTVGDIHYVCDGDRLIPANETEFARDRTFGYEAASLADYVEEKTEGRYKARDVLSISLEDLRGGDIQAIEGLLCGVEHFNKVLVNAADYADLKVFCIALYRAMARGKTFLFRSAAALVKVLGAVADGPLLTGKEMAGDRPNGGLIVVGSHTEKTTLQLAQLKELPNFTFFEFDVASILDEAALQREMDRCRFDELLRLGRSVCCYTSRELLTAGTGNREDELFLSVQVSRALQTLVSRLTLAPAYILAKGGITASDIGVKALGVRKALVCGQVQAGVPVWKTGPESRFPGLPFIIFPGNVGQAWTLKEVALELEGKGKEGSDGSLI